MENEKVNEKPRMTKERFQELLKKGLEIRKRVHEDLEKLRPRKACDIIFRNPTKHLIKECLEEAQRALHRASWSSRLPIVNSTSLPDLKNPADRR